MIHKKWFAKCEPILFFEQPLNGGLDVLLGYFGLHGFL